MTDQIVAIDGPSASGKGTLARQISAHYGWVYFDSGLLYRALGLLCSKQEAPLEHNTEEDWASLAAQITPLLLKNEALKLEQTAKIASQLAALPHARSVLFDYQRKLYADLPPHQWLVMDGRDIGTVIFPQAAIKIYLTADAETRAQRRLKEMQAQDPSSLYTYEQILKDIRARDLQDMQRLLSPLQKAQEAIVVDTSGLSCAQAFHQVQQIIDAYLFVKKQA